MLRGLKFCVISFAGLARGVVIGQPVEVAGLGCYKKIEITGQNVEAAGNNGPAVYSSNYVNSYFVVHFSRC